MSQLISDNLPIGIILVFTVMPLAIGAVAAKNSISTVGDFFLCGRSMGTFVSFFTVYATWWSSFAFLGSISYFHSVGSVYWTGIAWNLLFGLLYMIVGRRVWAYGRGRGYLTNISFFKDVYRSPTLNRIVTIVIIICTIPYIQIQFYGGAIILEMATMGRIPWYICALIFYVVMIIYLWSGGLRAVAWTDVFYGVLTFVGMISAGLIIAKYAGGIDNIFSYLSDNRPDLILLKGWSSKEGYPMWLSMFILLPLGEVMSSQMWTRMYATKSKSTFHIMPLLLSLATIAYLGSLIAGSGSAVIDSDIANMGDAVLPAILMKHTSPLVMTAIMCCGIAACLSTANSSVHSLSCIVAVDVYQEYVNPKCSEKKLVFWTKTLIVMLSAIAYLTLVFSNSPESIVKTGFISFSGLAQIAVPVFGALYWKSSTAIGSILGVSAGVIFTLTFSYMENSSLVFAPGVLALLLNAVIFIVCGLVLPENINISQRIMKLKNGNYNL